jgi:peroxiredoxin (alkyl hydroperoxide reductase subunit C)
VRASLASIRHWLTSAPEISLKDYQGKWLILGFIPMAWTFVWFVSRPSVRHDAANPHPSPTEIIAFSDAAQQFRERGAEVVFASVDSEYSLLSWASTPRKDGGLGSINIPLLSDKNHKISKDYGVLIDDEGIALRGLFIIDPKGVVRQVCPPTPQPTTRMDGCDVLICPPAA